MQTEEVTLSLPRSFLGWYEMVAKYYGWTMDRMIGEVLAADIECDLDNHTDLTGRILGRDLLINTCLDIDLRKFNRTVSWLDRSRKPTERKTVTAKVRCTVCGYEYDVPDVNAQCPECASSRWQLTVS